MIKTFIRFMKLMEKRLPIYLGAIFVSTLGTAGSKIANSYLLKHIITAAQEGSMEHVFAPISVTFAGLVLCLLLWRFGIIRYNIEGRTAAGTVEKLVFSKAMRLPMSYYEQNHSSDFMSTLIFDTQKASDIYTSRLRRLLAAILSAILYLVPMFSFSWELTLCFIGISLLSLMGNTLFAKPMKAVGRQLSDKNALMLEKLTNILTGMELVKIFAAGTKLATQYDAVNGDYFETQKHSNRLSAGLESLNCLFDLAGALAFLGLGIWFVSLGRVSLADLSAIYTLYGTFRYVFLEIGLYLPQMMGCIGNVEKIFAFLDMKEEPPQWSSHSKKDLRCRSFLCDKKDSATDDTMLSIQDICFSYDRQIPVLEHFSAEIKKGSFVAVTGESGCGKSTLAKLLLGFYPPESGQLTINGKSYADLTLEEIREQIAYVPQDPYLYETSIAENISYGKHDAGRKEIIAAAKAANAHNFITRLPNGYDTVLSARGSTLSGGERQRIAIARAIIRNAPVMLLDEATSALDNESEALVQEAIRNLKGTRTILMIAHRPSSIATADSVIHIRKPFPGKDFPGKDFPCDNLDRRL